MTKHRKPEHRKSLSRQVIRSKGIKVEQPKHRKSKDRMDIRSNAQRRSKFNIYSKFDVRHGIQNCGRTLSNILTRQDIPGIL